MRIVALGLVTLVALVASAPPAGAQASPAPAPAEAPSQFRIGLGVDLFAMERRPNRTDVRLLDLRVLRLLAVGAGDDPEYVRFGLLESPLFKMLSRRREGAEREFRILDLRLLAFLRSKRQAENQSEFHLLKLPLLGSLLGHERAGDVRRWTVLYAIRWKSTVAPEPPPEEPQPDQGQS
jgi:hypothetical protein